MRAHGTVGITSSSGATCRLSLPADLDAVREMAAVACRFLSEQKLTAQELIGCELALVEGCNNAVAYSTTGADDPGVEVGLACDSAFVEMQVIDHGPGFDWPEDIRLPEESEEHGRGLFIIQSVMQEVSYLRGRSENRLVMRMARAGDTDQKHKSCQQPERDLSAVQQKLALSEHVIGTMAKEICFRSEELAAIFRSTSQLGRTNDIEAFSARLLNDLLQITGGGWFILRLVSKDGQRIVPANTSMSVAGCLPIDLTEEQSQQNAEARAAFLRKEICFDEGRPLGDKDVLKLAPSVACGIVKPIMMGQTLLGTLAIGGFNAPLSATQKSVIETFTEFLAIQMMNIRLQQEHLDHHLTNRELQIASNIQQSLVPKSFPELTGYGLSGFCLSARQVGGDFFDVLPLNDHKLLLTVADVMGKGVPAALFAATLHTLIRAMAEWTHRPVELLERVNRLIYEELSGVDMFITAQIALVDTQKRRLVVASAGHCPLLLMDREHVVRPISPEGMPLGILPDVAFEHTIVPLEDVTAAVMYTDGLTEARNAHGEFFGQERFFKWLNQNRSALHRASALSDAFQAELKAFQGEVPLSDDQTFLVFAEQLDSAASSGEPVEDASPLGAPISASRET